MRNFIIQIVLCVICVSSVYSNSNFEAKHGIGIIHVSATYSGSGAYEISLFKHKGDSIAMETVSGKFKDDQFLQVQERFNHPPLKNKFGFAIQVITREGAWLQIRLSNGTKAWLKNDKVQARSKNDFNYIKVDRYSFRSWEQYIMNLPWIERCDTAANPIRQRRKTKSKIFSIEKECLKSVQMKGAWLKVAPQNGDGCLCEYPKTTEHDCIKNYFSEGWIQWRDENDFLIKPMYMYESKRF